MAGELQARLVEISVAKDGKIFMVNDPDTRIRHESGLPFDGKHYGWDLNEYFNAGFEEIKFLEKSAVAANAEGQKSDQNTLASQRVDMVKLDVGYWGAYNRDRE